MSAAPRPAESDAGEGEGRGPSGRATGRTKLTVATAHGVLLIDVVDAVTTSIGTSRAVMKPDRAKSR